MVGATFCSPYGLADGETHIFSPTLINEFKFGYNRWQIRLNNKDQGPQIARQLHLRLQHRIPAGLSWPAFVLVA